MKTAHQSYCSSHLPDWHIWGIHRGHWVPAPFFFIQHLKEQHINIANEFAALTWYSPCTNVTVGGWAAHIISQAERWVPRKAANSGFGELHSAVICHCIYIPNYHFICQCEIHRRLGQDHRQARKEFNQNENTKDQRHRLSFEAPCVNSKCKSVHQTIIIKRHNVISGESSNFRYFVLTDFLR